MNDNEWRPLNRREKIELALLTAAAMSVWVIGYFIWRNWEWIVSLI